MFKLEITTANAAFDEIEGDAGAEVARILRELAERVESGLPTGDTATVRDANGNAVGEWRYQSEA